MGSMTSRERMSAALSFGAVDYVPCSFMIFFNLHKRCRTETEFVERQVAMGLDACAHVGYLSPSLHHDAVCREWVERENDVTYFCRRIDTPKGPLFGRVRQWQGWPVADRFPLFNDWIVPRAEEVLVKPERDLEKLPYLFGPFKDDDIRRLKESARQAACVAAKHSLLLAGGWTSAKPGVYTDDGVMGADAMAWLSGYEDVMVLAELRPDLIAEYARIIHEWNMRQIEIYLDVGNPDIVFRRGWYETTEFWTPNAYRTIIAPTLRREAELIHQAGKKYGYIITSAFLPLLDDILDTGIDVLIGIDPEEGKGTEIGAVKDKCLERRCALWGGVSGAVTVEMGTPQETEEAVRAALSTLGRGGGFILSPVDNVREDTPKAWANTDAFVRAWKKHRITG